MNIVGHVQGVGFRYFCLKAADTYQLVGYARNLPDASVEVIAEGDKNTLECFIREIKRGSQFGNIADLSLEWSEPNGEFDVFEIR